MEGGAIMKSEQFSLDKSTVPLSVVVSAFFRGWGALATLVVSSFVFGIQVSELRGGLAAANARLDKNEAERKESVRDYQNLLRQTTNDISELKGTVRGFDQKLDLVIKLQRK